MKTFLTLLVASTAMTTVIGTTAVDARLIGSGDSADPVALDFEGTAQARPLILADNDSNSSWGFGRDDDDDDRRGYDGDRYDDDDDRYDDDDDDRYDDDDDDRYDDDDDDRYGDDDDRYGDDDDCDDDYGDDDDCRGGRNNPAPAGSVAPPQNGLFENGAAPQVQVN